MRAGPAAAGREWPRLLFLAGQALSVLGDRLAALAIPLLVLDLTRNQLVSALSAASVTVGYLLVGLPASVLVDRLDTDIRCLPGLTGHGNTVHSRIPAGLPAQPD